MYTKGLQSNQVMSTSQDYINETDYFNILNPLVISKMHDCLNVSKSDVKLIFLNIKRFSHILGMMSGFCIPTINLLLLS